MGNVVLIIVYNHRYDKNIEIIEQIYSNRFSNIYHLMPFYDGNKENVIPVYENSYYFQGYIAQGFRQFYKKDYTHYIFVADDLFLNPSINENNYDDYFMIQPNSSFISSIKNIHDCGRWLRISDAYHANLKIDGVEIDNSLPSYEVALQCLKKHDLTIKPLSFDQIVGSQKISNIKTIKQFTNYLFWRINQVRYLKKVFHLNYPYVAGYSDLVIIDQMSMRKFCQYCGIFAAHKLFVEVAIPTAMALSCNKIISEKDMANKGKALWSIHDLEILNQFNYQISKLESNFPDDWLYLHPVKLSKWNL